MENETVFFTGYARLPANLVARDWSNVLILEIEVDLASHIIVDASCDATPPLGERLLLGLLIGHNLHSGVGEIKEAIQRRYFSPMQKAILAGLDNTHACYLRYVKAHNEDIRNGSPEQGPNN